MTRRLGLAAVPAALCAGAMGQTTTLTVDSAQSQMDLTLTLNVSLLGSDTATDSSPISGTLEVELDDYGVPAAFTIHDFDLALSDDLAFNFAFFLSSVDATASSLGASYANPGTPVGPVPLPGGLFAFASVPTALSGLVVATGDVFGVGEINETIDLSTQEPFDAPADGMISSDGVTVTLDGGMITFSGSSEVIPGVATMDVAGTVTFVASGPAPAPAGCNDADLAEPFDVLDFSDVVAFLTAFGAMDPGADLAPPTGVFDFSDVVAFLGAFGAGCP
ncbi:MAG: GC-type dockerin domain-anchored protein [Phycisphaerales bacterium JB059]